MIFLDLQIVAPLSDPPSIPPDDLDDVILGGMVKEAGMFYKVELERAKAGVRSR